MEERDYENSKIGWACGLEKAGWRRKTVVLFSSFCSKSCGNGVWGGGVLNFYKLRRLGTSNIERPTLSIEHWKGLLSDDSSSASGRLFNGPKFTMRYAGLAEVFSSFRQNRENGKRETENDDFCSLRLAGEVLRKSRERRRRGASRVLSRWGHRRTQGAGYPNGAGAVQFGWPESDIQSINDQPFTINSARISDDQLLGFRRIWSHIWAFVWAS